MKTALTVLSVTTDGAWNAWLWACLILRFAKIFKRGQSRLLATVRAELRPFAPFLAVIPFLILVLAGGAGRWGWIVVPIRLWCWWMYRNDKDDDDRWKRRKEKLAAKISEVGGRLQVVPVRAS